MDTDMVKERGKRFIEEGLFTDNFDLMCELIDEDEFIYQNPSLTAMLVHDLNKAITEHKRCLRTIYNGHVDEGFATYHEFVVQGGPAVRVKTLVGGGPRNAPVYAVHHTLGMNHNGIKAWVEEVRYWLEDDPSKTVVYFKELEQTACFQCGSKVQSDWHFCKICGKQLAR
jgi:hypothetical protein